MNKQILIILFIGVMSSGFVMAGDWSVFQGQYYIENEFQVGTFKFDFNIYDDEFDGEEVFSYSQDITTGNWGQWKVEVEGISRAADNVSKDYFLEILIDGVPQLPRRRITQFDFLRKDVDEITAGSFITDNAYFSEISIGGKKVCLSDGTNCLNVSGAVSEEISISSLNVRDFAVFEPMTAPSDPEPGTVYLDKDENELRFYDGVSWFSIEIKKVKKTGRVTADSFSEAGAGKSEESVATAEVAVEKETVGETAQPESGEGVVEEEIQESKESEEVCKDVCTSEEVCEDVESCENVCEGESEEKVCEEVCSTKEVCKDVESCEEVCSIPEELFDITFNLEESTISGSEDLSGVVTFESFGRIPTPVDLEIFVIDGDGGEVYYDNIRVVVATENVIRWNYNGAELREGDYEVILKTVYNVDVTDEFRKKVEVRPGFWKMVTNWFWGFNNKQNKEIK